MGVKTKVYDVYQTLKQTFVEMMSSGATGFAGRSEEDVKEHLHNLQTTGVSKIKDYLTPEECRKIILDIDAAFDEHKEFVWTDEDKSDHRLHGSEKASERIAAFHNDPQLLKIASLFNQAETVDFSTLAARLVATKNNLGSGGGWHRDTPFESRQFKAILYLTDVDTGNGPFEYIKGTNNQSSLYTNILKYDAHYGQNRFTDAEIALILKHKAYRSEVITAKAGTVLLANTFGIHRGMPIEKGTRYALTNYYFPKATLDLQLFEKKFNPLRPGRS
jgi:hypothetical protein